MNIEPIGEKPSNNNLFNLSLLEEMDDNEYVSDILDIFLSDTPKELKKLQNACTSSQFDAIHKIAHKLKSNAGLLQAKHLQDALIKIEKAAIAKDADGLAKLYEQINKDYQKIASPLQIHLTNIKIGLK